MPGVVGATVGTEKRGARARASATRAPEYLRHDCVGSATTLDCRPLEGDLRVPKWRSRVGKPDGHIYRGPLHA